MLAKANRLAKKTDFIKVLKDGKAYFSPLFILKSLKNNLSCSRWGFVVSKKVSKKAVIRNKLKRRLREIIRKRINNINNGFDLVIIIKKTTKAKEKKFNELGQEIDNLLKKSNLSQ